MLDYHLLEAIAAVDREGSFELAARSLHVTPSAISQRVKLLEERLGAVLVQRGKPCAATSVGRRLCRHIEQVGMLERELREGLPALASSTGVPGQVLLRVAVNADSLGTWFIDAVARFAAEDDALLDVSVDDQDSTAEWLRTNQVLAAVTARSDPVPGCRSLPLGKLRYRATASPAFVARHFGQGVNGTSLARTPVLAFNPKDQLQRRWIRRVFRRELTAPTYSLPTSHAFLDACVAGLAWGMNAEMLAQPHLETGRLVELVPGAVLDVPLYWQHVRLEVPTMERLTEVVVAEARARLRLHPGAERR